MKQRAFGGTGISVSELSFGASSLGGVFHDIDEAEGIRAVHAALDAGITYFDVAPAYGGTRAETVLGKALKGVPRDRYVLSTKVGKYTDPDGRDRLDYRAERIRKEFASSLARLGVDDVDILYIHDIEYERGLQTEDALSEGLATVLALRDQGRTRAVGFGFYPVDLWRRVLSDYPVDAALIHNHYGLHDTRLTTLLPFAETKGVGVVNASPFASGLLTERGPAEWHPASAEDRAVAQAAAALCREHGTSIERLALQFAAHGAQAATLMFSTSKPEAVLRNVAWAAEKPDAALVSAVRDVLAPISDRDWF